MAAYDPVFNNVDQEALRMCGVKVLEAVGLADHVATCPTLFYMPHCGRGLYEEVVAANERAEVLS